MQLIWKKTPLRNMNIAFTLFMFVIFWPFTHSIAGSGLKIGTDFWPPYEFKTAGRVDGLCTDIIQAVLRKMEQRVDSLNLYPWARGQDLLRRGKLDALYCASRNPEREAEFRIPEEALTISKWVIFMRKADMKDFSFSSLADLGGKRAGVVRGYNYTADYWAFLKKSGLYDVTNDDQANFRKLASKRVDYILSEYAVGVTVLRELQSENQIVAMTKYPLKSGGLYVLFNKDNVSAKFVRQFSQKLKKFKTSQEYDDIMQHYLFPVSASGVKHIDGS